MQLNTDLKVDKYASLPHKYKIHNSILNTEQLKFFS